MDFQDVTESALKKAPPVLPWEKFADWVEVKPTIVRGWVERGYVPTLRIGKHVMVNVELFRQQLLEQL